MKNKSRDIFTEIFNRQPEISIHSPGRINLIGEHIDYYGGFVMPAAIDRYIGLSIGKTLAESCSVYSAAYHEKYSIDISGVEQPIRAPWVRYFTMGLNVLAESGFHTRAFNLTIDSDLPTGAGLSSSAALLTGFIEILSVLNKWSMAREKIALLAQTIEHRLGTPCGLMDQYASLFGKKDCFILLDCANLKYREIHVRLGDYRLRLYNTKVHHELTDGGYSSRRKQGEAALEELKSFYSKGGSYRDFTMSELDQMPIFDPIQYKRAKHAITEHQRVHEFAHAVDKNNFETAGSLLYATHQSLKDDYEVSCVEADHIVEIAKLEGIAGARMMGGGFGGCVLCLMDKKYEEPFNHHLFKSYRKRFGFDPELIEFELGEREIYL
ncbi:MAG: galactokinase [Saprospiraceae bacterium]